jgi:predicted HTH transcriptional regulator
MLYVRSLGKTNIKHCKIKCVFEIGIGPGTAESTVECHSSLDTQVLRIIEMISAHLRLIIKYGVFRLGFPTKTL